MKKIEISKEYFIKVAKENGILKACKILKISFPTAQKIAKELGVEFKRYKPAGRPKSIILIK